MEIKTPLCRECIGDIDQAQDYNIDNAYIIRGYRINFNSCKLICKSLFLRHNETVNIWSHAFGLALFLILFIHTYVTLGSDLTDSEWIDSINAQLETILGKDALKAMTVIEQQNLERIFEQQWVTVSDVLNIYEHTNQQSGYGMQETTEDALVSSTSNNRMQEVLYKIIQNQTKHTENFTQPYARWPIFVFIFSTIVCLSLSSVYHTFNDYSAKWNSLLSRVDYAGVSLLIAGSWYPPFYYIFYCEPPYSVIYLCGISIASIGVFISSLLPNFTTTRFQTIRGLLFLALGLFAATPLLHFGIQFYRFEPFASSLPLYLLMGLNYILGVVVYITKVPERCAPGRFDIWGSSHQIWHFMVICAAIFHYFAVLDTYYKRTITSCPS